MLKLASLALPPLAGKSFLDLGCNEGYFCGYAAFDGASRIVGIDNKGTFLAQARRRFPQCDFRLGNWERLEEVLKPEEKFDVMLCASALHYAEDQSAAVAGFMERLKPHGVLVLELGIVPGPDAAGNGGWHRVKRSIDERLFPDWSGLSSMLSSYTFKHMGESVPQAGDPISRQVIHVRHKLPYALLLMGAPGAGKSTLARMLAGNIPVISGDEVISENSASLAEVLNSNYNPKNTSHMVAKLFASGGAPHYAALATATVRGRTFIYDGYVPGQYRQIFVKELEKLGYVPVEMSLPAPEYSPNELYRRGRQDARKYNLFLSALESHRRLEPGV